MIRESKFHKSRLIPVSADAAREIDHLLDLRRDERFPVGPESPLLWHRYRAYSGGGLSGTIRALFRQAAIRTTVGRLPRIHDFRQHAGSRIMPGSAGRGSFVAGDHQFGAC